MPEPSDYRHVAAWGTVMHLAPHAVREMQELAAAEGAPIDATYLSTDGWHTFGDIKNAETREFVEKLLGQRDEKPIVGSPEHRARGRYQLTIGFQVSRDLTHHEKGLILDATTEIFEDHEAFLRLVPDAEVSVYRDCLLEVE